MRVANFSTSSGDDCPTGWTKITTPADPTFPSIDVCHSPNDAAGWCPVIFSVCGVKYYKICGMARDYQKGTPDVLSLQNSRPRSINGAYVDDLSITIGSPRQHVWTYVIGINEDPDASPNICPCAGNSDTSAYPDPFIGSHYYCESGITQGIAFDNYYTNDPLWDGEGCVNPNNNCCTSPGMPWFFARFSSFPKVQHRSKDLYR